MVESMALAAPQSGRPVSGFMAKQSIWTTGWLTCPLKTWWLPPTTVTTAKPLVPHVALSVGSSAAAQPGRRSEMLLIQAATTSWVLGILFTARHRRTGPGGGTVAAGYRGG